MSVDRETLQRIVELAAIADRDAMAWPELGELLEAHGPAMARQLLAMLPTDRYCVVVSAEGEALRVLDLSYVPPHVQDLAGATGWWDVDLQEAQQAQRAHGSGRVMRVVLVEEAE